jgi:hypothetical protein
MTRRRKVLLWSAAGVLLMFVAALLIVRPGKAGPTLAYDAFIEQVKASQVDAVVFHDSMLEVTGSRGQHFRVANPELDNTALIGLLQEYEVKLSAQPPPTHPTQLRLLQASLPSLLILALFAACAIALARVLRRSV